MARAHDLSIHPSQAQPANPAFQAEPKQGPVAQALEALWQEVASRPLWAPPNFFRYLRLRRQMNLQFIKPQDLASRIPPGKISHCHTCRDVCCVGPRHTVSLRLLDIARLMDMGREDLITHDKPIADLAKEPGSGVQQTLASPLWRRFPVLAQDAMGACRALTAQGRCSLYPRWPLSCARFPYSLGLSQRAVFYSQRCQSFAVHPRYLGKGEAMKAAAAACYNERLKDGILLAYKPQALEQLGLMIFVQPQC